MPFQKRMPGDLKKVLNKMDVKTVGVNSLSDKDSSDCIHRVKQTTKRSIYH